MPVDRDRSEYWRLMKQDFLAFGVNGIITALVVVVGIALKSDDVFHAAALLMPTFLLYSAYRALRYGAMPAGYGNVWCGARARLAGGFIVVVYVVVMIELWGQAIR